MSLLRPGRSAELASTEVHARDATVRERHRKRACGRLTHGDAAQGRPDRRPSNKRGPGAPALFVSWSTKRLRAGPGQLRPAPLYLVQLRPEPCPQPAPRTVALRAEPGVRLA